MKRSVFYTRKKWLRTVLILFTAVCCGFLSACGGVSVVVENTLTPGVSVNGSPTAGITAGSSATSTGIPIYTSTNGVEVTPTTGMSPTSTAAPGITAKPTATKGASASSPNIVFILIDDMGWKDTGCYGSTYYKTPNIDKLASEGMRFTNAYTTAPVCSPTRCSLLTGVSPSTLRMTNVIGNPEVTNRALIPATYNPLPDDPAEVRLNTSIPSQYNSFGDVLKSRGYDTCYTGKWHSGNRTAAQMGFDKVISTYDSLYHSTAAEKGDGDGAVTQKVTADAVKYIEDHANASKPFLLYVNHFTVHVPLQAYASNVSYFSDPANATPDAYQKNALYAAMLKEMDDGVGSIMQAIKDSGIDKETMVIFYSDNGGLSAVANPKTGVVETATNQYPLRAGKATLYEGGIRVPFIVRYPGVVPAGKVISTPITSEDFYPTLADFTGGSKPSYLEGLSLKVILTGKSTTLNRDTLYFHYPTYHASNQPTSAMREGNYKLLYFWEDERFELYDLSKDISEKNNLAASNPTKVSQMWTKFQAWLTKTNAPVPVKRYVEPVDPVPIGDEILPNGSMENGLEGWATQASAKFTVVTTPLYDGTKAMKVYNRTSTSDTIYLDVTQLVTATGQGTYRFGGAVRNVSGTTKGYVVIAVEDDNPRRWFTTAETTITADGYVFMTKDISLTWTGNLKQVKIYFQNTGGYTNDIYMDGFTMKRIS